MLGKDKFNMDIDIEWAGYSYLRPTLTISCFFIFSLYSKLKFSENYFADRSGGMLTKSSSYGSMLS